MDSIFNTVASFIGIAVALMVGVLITDVLSRKNRNSTHRKYTRSDTIRVPILYRSGSKVKEEIVFLDG